MRYLAKELRAAALRAAAVIALSAGAAAAQQPQEIAERIEADRPDFTEATSTVPPGKLQLEGGYTFTHESDSAGDTTAHAAPELLGRIGILSDLELRVSWVGYIEEEDRSSDTTINGTDDLVLGLKHSLYRQEETALPSISVILAASVPTGSSEVSADDTQAEAKLLWSYDLSEEMAVAGNINAASPVEDGERFFEAAASLTLGQALTDDLGCYLEYFGFYPNADAPDSSTTHYLNAGFVYALTDTLLLDARVGAGLNEEADDLFAGAGFAVQL